MANSIPSDGILVRNARLAVKAELEKKRALGLPVTRFDPKTKALYTVGQDGVVTVIGKATERK